MNAPNPSCEDDRSPERRKKDDEIRESVESEGTAFSHMTAEEREQLIAAARALKRFWRKGRVRGPQQNPNK